MTKQFNQVAEFYKAFNIPILQAGQTPAPKRIEMRERILKEEIKELIEALESGNIEHIAKESVDVQYVIFGNFLEMGWKFEEQFCSAKYNPIKAVELLRSFLIDEMMWEDYHYDLLYCTMAIQRFYPEIWMNFEQCFDAVHTSNLSKLDANGKPVLREDGKVIKSELYKPADLSFLNQEQIA